MGFDGESEDRPFGENGRRHGTFVVEIIHLKMNTNKNRVTKSLWSKIIGRKLPKTERYYLYE